MHKNAKICLEPPAHVDVLAHQVIGAAIEVHRHLGPGFLESIYEDALAVELGFRDIPFTRQPKIDISYKGCPVGSARPDFFIGNELVVEIKAVESLAPIHQAQVISYLKSINKSLGLLVNFKVRILKEGIRRVVMSRGSSSSRLEMK